jgi:hypothetical protein
MVTNALLAYSVGCDLNNALKQDARAPRSIAQTLPSGSSLTMHLDVPGNAKVHPGYGIKEIDHAAPPH